VRSSSRTPCEACILHVRDSSCKANRRAPKWRVATRDRRYCRGTSRCSPTGAWQGSLPFPVTVLHAFPSDKLGGAKRIGRSQVAEDGAGAGARLAAQDRRRGSLRRLRQRASLALPAGPGAPAGGVLLRARRVGRRRQLTARGGERERVGVSGRARADEGCSM
jgi:hypothetical protein